MRGVFYRSHLRIACFQECLQSSNHMSQELNFLIADTLCKLSVKLE